MKNGMKWAGTAVVAMMMSGVSVPAQNPIHVTYQWHMHQPIYYPYESVTDTDNNNRFSFSVRGVHDERSGNYGEWPKNAIQQGHDKGIAHSGAQMSFSGSLMENLNGIWGTGWRNNFRHSRNTLRTSMNNPRLDMVGFAYHHSLMPLTCYESMRMQIKLHKEAYFDNWGTTEYSKGFFPPESSFASHMIPALVDEGLEWVFVDSGHFDRTLEDFPWTSASSIRPNLADVRNGTAAGKASSWVQLQNVWAPTPVAAPFSYQPHRVRYVDPNSNPTNPTVKSMVAVPAARYEGNENGRGGYGAFKPENVWGTKVDKNNNAARPMIIVCHSDGDNFGMKNADAWNGQHGLFLDMINSNPDFEHTSVQDYLDMYPVPENDVIHAEAGSWIGIDGGTPYFYKWVEENAVNGEHPDFWSWSMIIAAQNRVIHADRLNNTYSMNDVRWGIGNDTAKAWHFYLQAETSCHWYWDFDDANPWDGNATRGANLSMIEANKVIAAHPGNDPMGPSIFPPQRKIWNPGGKHWNEATLQPSNFDVWTYVDDASGVADVRLMWRTGDYNSYKNLNEYAHEIYAHTPGKNSPWNSVTMVGDWYPTVKGPQVPDPVARAKRYTGQVTGPTNTLVSYFIEAVDTAGNTNRSIIMHVWVGAEAGSNVTSYVTFDPPAPTGCNPVTIKYKKSGSPLGAGQVYIHVGRNNWQGTITPNPAMTDSGDFWTYVYNPPAGTVLINAAFNNGAGTWDSNGGQNWSVAVTGCENAPTNTIVTFSADPRDCAPLSVTYNATNRPLATANPVHLMVSFDAEVTWNNYTMTNQGNLVWAYTFPTETNATNAIVTFHDNGIGTNRVWDGDDYATALRDCDAIGVTGPSVTVFSPAVPSGCEPVTISYRPNDGPLKSVQPIRIHIGRNGWKDVIAPAPAMTLQGNGTWTYTYTPAPGTYEINCVFNNGSGIWDNNSGSDWKLLLSECDVIEGVIITTPPSNITVAVETDALAVSGLAGEDIFGTMRWSNALTGATGTMPASTAWNAGSIALGIGENVISVSGSNTASSVITNAQDMSGNYSAGWTNGANLGTGFGPWALFANATAGHFIATNGFGLWAQVSNLSEAVRSFASPMAVGQRFSATIQNKWILEGQQGVGMALRNAAGDSLLQFFFNGGDTFYTVSDAAGGRSSGINWTDQSQAIHVTLTSTSSYVMTVGAVSLTGTVNGVISQARFWSYNGGVGDNYNFYFDNLLLTSAGAGAGQSYTDSVSITRTSGFLDTDNDGIDDAWETLHFGNLTTANGTSDWDGNGFRDLHEFKAGTNPKNAAEFLRADNLTMGPANGNMIIHWFGANGRSYNLFRSTNLVGGTYVCIESNIPYTPSMNVYTDSFSGAGAQYYWIEVK
jgi:hypothetical protein